MKLTTMRILRALTAILLFSSFCSVFSHPSRPLNERSAELAWQAWLLVDDQNQSKQDDPDMMRRKVIAKSVFIAPTFNPDKLPPCAEGYISDSMGRCVKVIQLDSDANLDFLLQKLIGKIGGAVAGESRQEESLSTPGPIQFNIPFDGEEDGGGSSESSDFAIVVAQTSKRDQEIDDPILESDMQESEDSQKGVEENTDLSFVAAPTNGGFDPAKLDVKNEEKNSGDTETTIIPAATEATIEQAFSTTSSSGDEVTTTPPETTTLTVPTESPTSTTEDQQALFYKIPSQDSPQVEKNGPNASSSNADAPIGSQIKFEEETINNDEPDTQHSTNIDNVSSRVTFKDDLMTSENVRHASSRIRFPGEKLVDHTTDLPLEFLQTFKRPQRENHEYSPTRGSVLTTNIDENHDRLQSNFEHHAFNHRNRDRNFWRLSQTWRESSPKRAFVLRFSNGPSNGDHLYRHSSRNSRPVYRQVPIEDLSYIFGHRRKHSNHR